MARTCHNFRLVPEEIAQKPIQRLVCRFSQRSQSSGSVGHQTPSFNFAKHVFKGATRVMTM
jgi:hypothetical protein